MEQANTAGNTRGPITITYSAPAWLASHYTVDDFLARIRDGKPVGDMLTLWSWDLSKGDYPYTAVGDADVTLRIFSRDVMVTSQIEALKGQLDAERAKWLTKQQEILDRISKLQALTNEVEA